MLKIWNKLYLVYMFCHFFLLWKKP